MRCPNCGHRADNHLHRAAHIVMLVGIQCHHAPPNSCKRAIARLRECMITKSGLRAIIASISAPDKPNCGSFSTFSGQFGSGTHSSIGRKRAAHTGSQSPMATKTQCAWQPQQNSAAVRCYAPPCWFVHSQSVDPYCTAQLLHRQGPHCVAVAFSQMACSRPNALCG